MRDRFFIFFKHELKKQSVEKAERDLVVVCVSAHVIISRTTSHAIPNHSHLGSSIWGCSCDIGICHNNTHCVFLSFSLVRNGGNGCAKVPTSV